MRLERASEEMLIPSRVFGSVPQRAGAITESLGACAVYEDEGAGSGQMYDTAKSLVAKSARSEPCHSIKV
jgi:hypothetical protein